MAVSYLKTHLESYCIVVKYLSLFLALLISYVTLYTHVLRVRTKTLDLLEEHSTTLNP